VVLQPAFKQVAVVGFALVCGTTATSMNAGGEGLWFPQPAFKQVAVVGFVVRRGTTATSMNAGSRGCRR
jgi:hypothetical protein